MLARLCCYVSVTSGSSTKTDEPRTTQTTRRIDPLRRSWRNSDYLARGVVLKKKWGTPETRLRQRFLNNLGLHTCCTEIILHCVSVSNQLQQWTNFCTNFSPQKWGSGGRVPLSKKLRGRRPPRPRFTTPLGLAIIGVKCMWIGLKSATFDNN